MGGHTTAEIRRCQIGWPSHDGFSAVSVAESTAVDILFGLKGGTIPSDHGYALFLQVRKHLAWLDEEECAGIHPIRGAPTGTGELLLGRRARLGLRVPLRRAEGVLALAGNRLALGTPPLTVGPATIRPLSAYSPLYSACVMTGGDDEAAFAAAILRLLDEKGIETRFICGRRQAVETAGGMRLGYSLLLHGLPLKQSIHIQEAGLGDHRKLGCGIFVPHKSITALE